ncbi:MAG: pilus assembly protein [Actinobacteria bacterium]|nr:pilus assembly protein [Actinomycetota bacterium]
MWGRTVLLRIRGRLGASATDQGAAVVEFVVLAVVVMVPLVYVILVVLQVHAGTYAVVTAAREAGRAYVSADSTTAGSARARSAARVALADQGFEEPHLRIRCSDGPCLSPGSRVQVRVKTHITIPLTPYGDGRWSIPVSAGHEVAVDSYRQS